MISPRAECIASHKIWDSITDNKEIFRDSCYHICVDNSYLRKVFQSNNKYMCKTRTTSDLTYVQTAFWAWLLGGCLNTPKIPNSQRFKLAAKSIALNKMKWCSLVINFDHRHTCHSQRTSFLYEPPKFYKMFSNLMHTRKLKLILTK